MDTYVIGWYSKHTNAAGLGQQSVNLRECLTLCRQANEQLPSLEHFPVDAKTKEPVFIAALSKPVEGNSTAQKGEQ